MGGATSLRVVNLCPPESELGNDDLSRFAVGVSLSPELHMEGLEKGTGTRYGRILGVTSSRMGNPEHCRWWYRGGDVAADWFECH